MEKLFTVLLGHLTSLFKSNVTLILAIVCSTVLSSSSFAQINSANLVKKLSPTEEPDKAVEFEGNMRLDNDLNPNENGVLKENLRTQRFELQLKVRLAKDLPDNIAKNIHFIVRSKTEQNFIVEGKPSFNSIAPLDYIKEGYFQFTGVANLPLDILIGTTETSYGQDYRGTLDFQNDAAHAMTDPDQGQIKGITVIIDHKLLNVIDKVEATFFAPDPDIRHLSLNHADGFAIRLSKNVSEQVSLQTSFIRKNNSYDPSLSPETKVSVAGVYTNDPWTVWLEAVQMNSAEPYPQANFGATTGVARLIGPGQANVEYTGINKTLNQFAVGYQYFLTRNWTLGATYRYTLCQDGNLGCMNSLGRGEGSSFNIAVRFGFGGTENTNPIWFRKNHVAQ